MKKSLLLLLLGLFAFLSAKTGIKSNDVFIKVTSPDSIATVGGVQTQPQFIQGATYPIKFSKQVVEAQVYQIELWKGGEYEEEFVGGPFDSGNRTKLKDGTGGQLVCNIAGGLPVAGGSTVMNVLHNWEIPVAVDGIVLLGKDYRIKVKLQGNDAAYDFTFSPFEIVPAKIVITALKSSVPAPTIPPTFFLGRSDTVKWEANLREAASIKLYTTTLPYVNNANQVLTPAKAINGDETGMYNGVAFNYSVLKANYTNYVLGTGTNPHKGTYEFVLPHFPNGDDMNYADTNYVIVVASQRDLGLSDTIRVNIVDPAINITNPSAGQTLVRGLNTITWSESINDSAVFRVTNKPGTPAYDQILNGLGSKPSDVLIWDIAEAMATGDYTMTATSKVDGAIVGVQDFKVGPPVIRITNLISSVPGTPAATFFLGRNDIVKWETNFKEPASIKLYTTPLPYVNNANQVLTAAKGINDKDTVTYKGALLNYSVLKETYIDYVSGTGSNPHKGTYEFVLPHFLDADNRNYDLTKNYVIVVASKRDPVLSDTIRVNIINPIITITRPAANQVFIRGQQSILWNESINDSAVFRVTNKLGTPAYDQVINGLGSKPAGFFWNIPQAMVTGSYTMTATSKVDDVIIGVQDFRIAPTKPTVTLINPKSGGAFERGTRLQITWETSSPDTFALELYHRVGTNDFVRANNPLNWTPVPRIGDSLNYSPIGYKTTELDGTLKTGAGILADSVISDIILPGSNVSKGVFVWQIPSNLNGNDFRIIVTKITPWTNPLTGLKEVIADSTIVNQPFSIIPGIITFSAPKASCKMSLLTQKHKIDWYSKVENDSVRLDLYKGGMLVSNLYKKIAVTKLADSDTTINIGLDRIYEIADSLNLPLNNYNVAGEDYQIMASSLSWPRSTGMSANFTINGTLIYESFANPSNILTAGLQSPWIVKTLDMAAAKVTVNSGRTVTLQKGAALVLMDTLIVHGTLIADSAKIFKGADSSYYVFKARKPFTNGLINVDGGTIKLTNSRWFTKPDACGNIWDASTHVSELVTLKNANSSSFFKNVLFTSAKGSAMKIDGSSPSIFGCTFTNNGSDNTNDNVKGGALYITGNSQPTIYNTILWGNKVDPVFVTPTPSTNANNGKNGVSVFLNNTSAKPIFAYNCIEGGLSNVGLENNAAWGEQTPAATITDKDPMLFLGATTTIDSVIYTLRSGTSCQNVGTPMALYSTLGMPALDLWGNARTYNSTLVDIGCSESTFSGIPSDISNNQICDYSLSQNYPNPFNPETTIAYTIKDGFSGIVNLKIYNTKGEVMQTISKNISKAGHYSQVFNGSKFTSGVYFYSIEAGDFKQMKKMIMVK